MNFKKSLNKLRNMSDDEVVTMVEKATGKELVSYEGIDALVAALMGFYNGELKKKSSTGHKHTKEEITNFPSSLKNPNALTIQANGSSLGSYDGSSAKTFNITAGGVGAYTKPETDTKLSGKLNKGSLPTKVTDAKGLYDLIENNSGLNFDPNLLFLNDVGTKTQGKIYFDKNKKGMFKCIKQTTGVVNSTEFFVDISNNASSDKLENLSKELPNRINEYNSNAVQKTFEFNTHVNDKLATCSTDLENKTSVEVNKTIDQVKKLVGVNPAGGDAISVGGKTRLEFDKEIKKIGDGLTFLNEINVKEYSGALNNSGIPFLNIEDKFQEKYSELISVFPNKTISLSHSLLKQEYTWLAVALYDRNQNFIRREILLNNVVTDSINHEYKIPDNIFFIRITYRSFGIKIKIKTGYNLNEILYNLNDERVKLNANSSLMKFDYIGYLTGSGSIHIDETNGERTSSIIPVNSVHKYSFVSAIPTGKSPWMAICTYDEGMNLIERIVNTNITKSNFNGKDYGIMEIIIPKNCKYLRFSTRTYFDGIKFIGESDSNLMIFIKEILALNITEKEYINNNIKSINHRGYNTIAPENTLSAFKLSKKMGFNYVEADVSFTSDKIPVLLHDNTIDRTSNGTGAINTLTFEQVRTFDFGSWKSADFTGEKIPSFDEFIILCRNIGLYPYIEIKGNSSEQEIKSLVDIVAKNGMIENVTWISFGLENLIHVKKYETGARLGYIVNNIDQVTITNVESLKTTENKVFIDANQELLTEETVKLCLNAKIPLEIWTLNDSLKLKTLNNYITGITSDYIKAETVLLNENII